MKLRHSEEDYDNEDFVPPELRAESYEPPDVEAPVMIPDGEIAGVDEEPTPPPVAGPSREELLRRVLEAQDKHDAARAAKISKASKLDRKRQNEDDLGALLYAAGTRKSPQFRNLGKSHTEEAMASGNQGPLSRELALQNMLSRYKPEDPEMRAAKLKMYSELAGSYSRSNPPKPEDPLTEKKGAKLDAEIDRIKNPPAPKPRVPARGAGSKEDAEVERQAERLAKELGGDPAKIRVKLDRLDAAAASTSDLPGVGVVEGRLPDVFTSQEGVVLKNEAKSLVNALLFLQSGAGVSNQEREQQYKLYGIEGGDERSFREGLKRLRRDIAAEVKAKQAGVRPEAVKKYHERGGTIAEDFEPGIQTDSEGKKWRELPDGSFEEVL